MAKIGVAFPVYKTDKASGVIAEAIRADIKINSAKAKLYADNKVAESEDAFQDGTISYDLDDLLDEVQADLLGHTIDDGEIIANESDVKPFVGTGFYAVKVRKGVRKYRAVWFTKVQFSEPDDNNQTKGENMEYRTPTLDGTIMLDDNGDWKREKTFSTEKEAKEYLEALAEIIEKCKKPVSDKDSGDYDSSVEVVLTAGAGEDIYYTINGTTPSKTNGVKYISAVTVSSTCALKAIAVADGKKDSEIATYEYFIS